MWWNMGTQTKLCEVCEELPETLYISENPMFLCECLIGSGILCVRVCEVVHDGAKRGLKAFKV